MHVIVTCTLRSMQEQAALYAQGRGLIAAVNALGDWQACPLSKHRITRSSPM
jgi:hypothetical protein